MFFRIKVMTNVLVTYAGMEPFRTGDIKNPGGTDLTDFPGTSNLGDECRDLQVVLFFLIGVTGNWEKGDRNSARMKNRT
jgi:hypothetical protein